MTGQKGKSGGKREGAGAKPGTSGGMREGAGRKPQSFTIKLGDGFLITTSKNSELGTVTEITRTHFVIETEQGMRISFRR